LNRPRGFAMKFHNEELHLLEDIVELIVIRNCYSFIVQKRYSSNRPATGIKIIAVISNVLRFDPYSMYYSISQGIILINATNKMLLITNKQ
jgi:hypothetical protein